MRRHGGRPFSVPKITSREYGRYRTRGKIEKKNFRIHPKIGIPRNRFSTLPRSRNVARATMSPERRSQVLLLSCSARLFVVTANKTSRRSAIGCSRARTLRAPWSRRRTRKFVVPSRVSFRPRDLRRPALVNLIRALNTRQRAHASAEQSFLFSIGDGNYQSVSYSFFGRVPAGGPASISPTENRRRQARNGFVYAAPV